MATTTVSRGRADTQVLWLQFLTLGWMLLECSVSLSASLQAKSVSLLAFGSDSLVELISAAVVLLQFSSRWQIGQARAARACGSLLYLLAGIVTLISIGGFVYKLQSDTSKLGMAITAGALLFMPILARLKRDAAIRLGSRALRADAVQSATCAYLAAITLSGLLLRSFLGFRWLDQVAAFVAVPILIVEARRARKGQVCSRC
jgi:divalent metal cation (Fe/Co/Zn/Cd) transporter